MSEVICPECRRPLAIPPSSKAGDILPCPFCAGVALRLREGEGGLMATVVKKASCPLCGEEVVLPDDIRPGAVIEHCGQRQKVTFEYGSYALDPI